MGVIDELWVRLGLDASKFKAGMAEAKTSLTTWRDETNKSSADMAKWGAAITATAAPVVALGTAVYSMQQKFGAMADQISDLSYTTGMSTEKIQQLQYAAVLSNDSFSTVAMGINYLTLSMQKAGDATSEAGKAFAALGVSTAGKSPDQVFEETTTALMGMEDTTRRNEIAMTLYGRSWKEMLPFMEEYIQNREKIQKTETFSKQELQDLKDAKKAWDDLGNSVTIYTGKALVETQKGTDLLLAMDTAYRKLGTGDVKGFLADAGKYRDKQVDIEQQKLKDLLATNAAGSSGITSPAGKISEIADPFAGKTAEEAKIILMRDYTIPGLEKKYKELATSGSASMEEIAAASLTVIEKKQELIDLITEETGAQKDLKSATDALYDSQNKLNDIDKDYSRNLQQLDPRDIQGFINLKMRYQWDKEDQQKEVADAQLTVDTSKAETEIKNLVSKYDGAEINLKVTASAPPIMGTPEQNPAQAVKPFDLVDFYTKNGVITAPSSNPTSGMVEPQLNQVENIINIPSPFISSLEPATPTANNRLPDVSLPPTPTQPDVPAGKRGGDYIFNAPITVNGDKSFEQIIQNARIRAGVRS